MLFLTGAANIGCGQNLQIVRLAAKKKVILSKRVFQVFDWSAWWAALSPCVHCETGHPGATLSFELVSLWLALL